MSNIQDYEKIDFLFIFSLVLLCIIGVFITNILIQLLIMIISLFIIIFYISINIKEYKNE